MAGDLDSSTRNARVLSTAAVRSLGVVTALPLYGPAGSRDSNNRQVKTVTNIRFHSSRWPVIDKATSARNDYSDVGWIPYIAAETSA